LLEVLEMEGYEGVGACWAEWKARWQLLVEHGRESMPWEREKRPIILGCGKRLRGSRE